MDEKSSLKIFKQCTFIIRKTNMTTIRWMMMMIIMMMMMMMMYLYLRFTNILLFIYYYYCYYGNCDAEI